MAGTVLRLIRSDRRWGNGDSASNDLNPWLKMLSGQGEGILKVRGGGDAIDRHTGTASSSNNYQADFQSTVGDHVAVPLSTTAASAVRTPANSVLLVQDSGITVNAMLVGGNIAWKSGTAFTMTLDHAATADRLVTFQDLAGTVALLGAANVGSLLFVDNAHDIGAAGATRPRDLHLSRTATIGTSVVVPTVGPVAGQQHALPAVASDTVALVGAAQNLLLKTITSPTMAGTWAAPAVDPPTVNGQVTRKSQASAWASFFLSGGVLFAGEDYNVASTTRNGTGDYSIVWDRDFAGATYALVASIEGSQLTARVNSKTSSGADIHVETLGGVKADPFAVHVVAFGALS